MSSNAVIQGKQATTRTSSPIRGLNKPSTTLRDAIYPAQLSLDPSATFHSMHVSSYTFPLTSPPFPHSLLQLGTPHLTPHYASSLPPYPRCPPLNPSSCPPGTHSCQHPCCLFPPHQCRRDPGNGSAVICHVTRLIVHVCTPEPHSCQSLACSC
jgi:hypothetical protein